MRLPTWLIALGLLAWMALASPPALYGAQAYSTQSTPTLNVSPTSGSPGTPVTITGGEFPPGEVVAIYVDVPGAYLDVPASADAKGSFKKVVTWPGKDYDPSGRVNPAAIGSHTVCGDTNYPGSDQKVAAKACAQFRVIAGPSPSVRPSPTPTPSGSPVSPSAIAVVIVVMVAVAAGAFLLLRRSL